MDKFEYTDMLSEGEDFASTAIETAWYNSNDHTAAFEFAAHDTVVFYGYVRPADWQTFKVMSSKGKAYNQLFKNNTGVVSLGSEHLYDVEFCEASEEPVIFNGDVGLTPSGNIQVTALPSLNNDYTVHYEVEGEEYTHEVEAVNDTIAETILKEQFKSLGFTPDFIKVVRYL